MQKSKRDKAKVSSPLMQHFKYDAHDLQDNQQGFISHHQKTSLKWYLFRNTIFITAGGFMAGLWLFLFIILSSHAWLDADSGVWNKVFFTGGLLFSGGMLILALISIVEVWRCTLHDLQNGRVDQISGTVTKYERRRHKEGTSRWIVIQGYQFDIDHNQYEAIENLKPYHLYLAEKTRRILALETAPMSYQDKVKTDEKAKRHG